MAVTTYTVKKGNTLWGIASGAYGAEIANSIAGTSTQEKVDTLVTLNNIPNNNYITVGQVLKLTGTPTKPANSTNPSVTVHQFGLVSDTDRSVFVSWYWTYSSDTIDYFRVIWYYQTGESDTDNTPIWFIGEDKEHPYNNAHGLYEIYDAPTNAYKVMVKILPVAKKHNVNGSEVYRWTGSWTPYSTYYFSDNPAPVPAVPTVTIDKHKLTAYINNLDNLTTEVQFQIRSTWDDILIAADASSIVNGVTYENQTTVQYTIDAGKSYRVRARAMNKHGEYSDWSEYSDPVHSMPTPPKEITELKALSETSVYIAWSKVSIATDYTVEYTTDKTYFDSNSSEIKSITVESNVTHAEITGMESGEEYFFRVRATNEGGDSEWTEIKTLTIGKDPAAPTTWSSTTTAITGEPVIFYWVHNSEDNSSQTVAELELTIGGTIEVFTITNTTDEDEKDRTSSYTFDTTYLAYGTEILWRVRTAGITGVYGDWSIQRTVTVNAPATLALAVTDKDENVTDVIRTFPFYIYGVAGPITQRPVGYSVSVISRETYETIDHAGNIKMVAAGETVYSKYFDVQHDLLVEMSAGNIDLENNIFYTVQCTVAMSSGLTATDSSTFRVSWSENAYTPNAEIGIDKDNVAVYIRPYCEYYPDNSDKLELVKDVTLSVYRKEFDGSFTEIATGLKNTSRTFVTDPHPALDYARYRIVATTESTGAVSYYDMPGYPIGEKAVIIQWAEEWSNFNTDEESPLAQPAWSGSLLRLPYNIDVSENYAPDVSLIKYIGRKHPVSYYGTHIDTTPTWNMVIDKKDVETIYALRRLAIWPGNVYVREPSGTGYWAHVTVSFSQKHTEVTIPVTLSITRVEGGV